MKKLWNLEGKIRVICQRLVPPAIRDIGKRIIDYFPKSKLQFEYHLAEHCDLKCVGCAHFSPLAKPEFADFEEASQDFMRLSELFGKHVRWIHLLGGEPLLHPDLIKFLKMARENFPTARIELLTNGVKLPKQSKEFWLACRKYKIIIRPTKYPIKLDYTAIEDLARKYQVDYRYYGDAQRVKTLFKWGLDMKGKQNPTRNFLKCHMANSCIQLVHGRLYTCNMAAYIHHFNQYFHSNLETCQADSIDIYQAKSRKQILKFLYKPIPFCRYCMGKVDNAIPWHSSRKDIKEWTV